MLVTVDIGAIAMCVLFVAMNDALAVNMRALRSTNIAVGINVSMQAAQLQGEQA